MKPISPSLIIINTIEEVNALIRHLSAAEFVAVDIETTGLTQRDQVIGFSVCSEESVAYYVVLQEWIPEKGALVPREGALQPALELLRSLQSKKLIGHNAIFDCSLIESNFNISLIGALHTDTMILAHLLNENRKVGLKELAWTIFGDGTKDEQEEVKASALANGATLTQDCYELYKADPMVMGKYGAKDAWLTYKLFIELVPELYEQNLDKFFYEDESMPLLRGPTYELNTTGLQVDIKRLTELKQQLKAECAEAKDFIYQEITPYVKTKYSGTNKKNTFNIGSSQQLSWLLFGELQLEFSTLTDAGKAVCKSLDIKLPYVKVAKRNFIHDIMSRKGDIYQMESIVNGKKKAAKKVKDPWAYIACNKATLTKLAPKYKWIERLLEYQRKMKLLSTYIEGLEQRIQYGVIRPSFLQHGTTSGRYASRNPNFQNLPRNDKRIKEFIVSRPGKVFVGADYSQLEPRVFAYTSADDKLKSAFNGTDDFYSVIGMDVFGKTDCTPKKEGSPDAFGIKYKILRDNSKVIALASTYGATAHQLAPQTGKSIEDTQLDIDNYFEAFPGVKQMMLDSHKMVKETGQVSNLFGRIRRIPEAKAIPKFYKDIDHAELPYQYRTLLNLAVNHRIQSTGASIVNRAAIKNHANLKLAGINAKLVLQVHDSLIIECDATDADNVAILLEDSMVNTVTLPGVPLEAVPKIGTNLAQV